MPAKLVTGLMYTALIGGAVLFSEGTVVVNVKEKKPEGHQVFVVAPATLATWGVRFVPEEHLRNMPPEARQALPAVIAAARELENIPDAVLVEVENNREHVKIEKRGSDLVVDVDSDKETVHVSIPLRAVRHTIENLQARQR